MKPDSVRQVCRLSTINLKMKYFILLLFAVVAFKSYAQPTAGTTGLLNIPSAEMQDDGTFMAGANYLPTAMTPETWDYNTGNYYINITFLPFLEVSYRMTLLKNPTYDEYREQDRSFSARLRLLKEKKYLPAFVVGGNDLYTSTSSGGNQYFGNIYAVSTKHIELNNQLVGFTLGYAPDIDRNKTATGIFGGISYAPSQKLPLQMYAEYDTKAFNVGASGIFFKHLKLYVLLNDFRDFAGGFVFFANILPQKKDKEGKNRF